MFKHFIHIPFYLNGRILQIDVLLVFSFNKYIWGPIPHQHITKNSQGPLERLREVKWIALRKRVGFLKLISLNSELIRFIIGYSVSDKADITYGISQPNLSWVVTRKSSCSRILPISLCSHMGHSKTSLHISACLLNALFLTSQILYTFYSYSASSFQIPKGIHSSFALAA